MIFIHFVCTMHYRHVSLFLLNEFYFLSISHTHNRWDYFFSFLQQRLKFGISDFFVIYIIKNLMQKYIILKLYQTYITLFGILRAESFSFNHKNWIPIIYCWRKTWLQNKILALSTLKYVGWISYFSFSNQHAFVHYDPCLMLLNHNECLLFYNTWTKAEYQLSGTGRSYEASKHLQL